MLYFHDLGKRIIVFNNTPPLPGQDWVCCKCKRFHPSGTSCVHQAGGWLSFSIYSGPGCRTCRKAEVLDGDMDRAINGNTTFVPFSR